MNTRNLTNQQWYLLVGIFVILLATGAISGLIELVIGLALGIMGLFVGLLGGALGLLVGLFGTFFGLFFGLMPIWLPVLIVYFVVRRINGDAVPKQKNVA